MTGHTFAKQPGSGRKTHTVRNATGIPGKKKQDFEYRPGLSFDDVRIRYNSGRPAQLQALTYTQGTDVYIPPGQEKHPEHESGHGIRPKTKITYVPGYYDYNYDCTENKYKNRVTVGWEMKAYLNPEYPVHGSSANNKGIVHKDLLYRLKEKWNKNIIRGHLLNDHLGGLSVEENLFPISSKANNVHLNKIERFVKGLVYGGGGHPARPVQYDVTVLNQDDSSQFNENMPRTKFQCHVVSEPSVKKDGTPLNKVDTTYEVLSDISQNTSNGTSDGPFRTELDPFSSNTSNKWAPVDKEVMPRPKDVTDYTLMRDGKEVLAYVDSSGCPFIASAAPKNVPRRKKASAAPKTVPRRKNKSAPRYSRRPSCQ